MNGFRNYKLRFYPNKSQVSHLENEFKLSMKLWNKAINAGTFNSNHSTELDFIVEEFRKKYPALNYASKTVLEQKLFDLRKAISDSKTKGLKPPSLKVFIGSARYRGRSNGVIYSAREKYLELPRLGELNIVWSRVPSGISMVTVLRSNTGKWFVNILSRCEIEPLSPTGRSCIAHFNENGIETNDDNEYEADFNGALFAVEYFYNRIRRLKKGLKRKHTGSSSHKKQKLLIDIAFEKLINVRNDAIQKLSSSLIRDYSEITIVNDINRKGQINTTLVSLRKTMQYKAKWHNRKLILKKGLNA